ncbi:MAG: hypothetical protein ACOYM3_27780 [Terrimicrobiaceae bacterium]
MLKKSNTENPFFRAGRILIFVILVCAVGGPWTAALRAEDPLRTAGPWPDSTYKIGTMKRLPSGKVVVPVWIVAGSSTIDVISLSWKTPAAAPGEEAPVPDPFTLDGAYLENAITGQKFPLVAPSMEDGYVGSSYTVVQLAPRASTSMAAVFAAPAAEDPKKPPIYRLYLPGAAQPVDKIVLPD